MWACPYFEERDSERNKAGKKRVFHGRVTGLGSYNQGIMLNATPNLDKLASEGMRVTDYYAELAPPD
jgi:hypothetical protein